MGKAEDIAKQLEAENAELAVRIAENEEIIRKLRGEKKPKAVPVPAKPKRPAHWRKVRSVDDPPVMFDKRKRGKVAEAAMEYLRPHPGRRA